MERGYGLQLQNTGPVSRLQHVLMLHSKQIWQFYRLWDKDGDCILLTWPFIIVLLFFRFNTVLFLIALIFLYAFYHHCCHCSSLHCKTLLEALIVLKPQKIRCKFIHLSLDGCIFTSSVGTTDLIRLLLVH